MSPTKKQMIDRKLVKEFKVIQEQEYKTWKGINLKFTSRPGMGDCQNQTGLGIAPTSDNTTAIKGPISISHNNITQIYVPSGSQVG